MIVIQLGSMIVNADVLLPRWRKTCTGKIGSMMVIWYDSDTKKYDSKCCSNNGGGKLVLD